MSGLQGHDPGNLKAFEHFPEYAIADVSLATAEGQLMVYRHHGFFYAMDTFREYQHLNDLWNSGSAPWAVWT